MSGEEFDPADFVSRADRTVGTLSDQVAAFVELSRKALAGKLWNNEAVEIGFFAFTAGKPEVFVRTFEKGTAKTGVEMLEREQFHCFPCSGLPPVELSSNEAMGVWNKKPGLFDRNSPVHLAKQLLELQIEMTPEHVGRPISILSITPKGTEWQERGLCSW